MEECGGEKDAEGDGEEFVRDTDGLIISSKL